MQGVMAEATCESSESDEDGCTAERSQSQSEEDESDGEWTAAVLSLPFDVCPKPDCDVFSCL